MYTVESITDPGVITTWLPSLRELADQVLGNKLQDIHDSVQDAKTSGLAAAHILIHGPQRSIIRNTANRTQAVGVETTLLVHRIPDSFTEHTIEQLFVLQAHVAPTVVASITGRLPNSDLTSSEPGRGKCTITFASKGHADLAFESLNGPNRPDKGNMPQKRIYLKGGGYFCVRKNVAV